MVFKLWLFEFLIMIVTAKIKRDYHEEVGIPLAKWIKKTEDEIHARPVSGRRVVGGGVAPTNFYPYLGGLIIEIVNRTEPSVCGSTLITSYQLVTAAHCWKSEKFEAKKLTVVLASEFLFTGGTREDTSKVLPHPEFNLDTLRNDVALIFLTAPFAYTDTIKPALLPYVYASDSLVGRTVVTAGYGRTRTHSSVSINSVLSHVELQIISESQCKKYYKMDTVQSSNICTDGTGGVGICDGDSGGPLVIVENGHAILVGIASFAAEGDCEDGYPSVFTRVSSVLPFIRQHVDDRIY